MDKRRVNHSRADGYRLENLGLGMNLLKCPPCGADMKDWRHFSEKSELDKAKPFECVGFRCGKRWSEEELKQRVENGS